MSKESLVTPASMAARRDAHRKNCEACKSDRMCADYQHILEQLQTAIQRARWKPPVPLPPNPDMPVSYTDPACIHEHMRDQEPHDCFTCERCQLYAIKRRAELGEKK